jgi:hypothetical protein
LKCREGRGLRREAVAGECTIITFSFWKGNRGGNRFPKVEEMGVTVTKTEGEVAVQGGEEVAQRFGLEAAATSTVSSWKKTKRADWAMWGGRIAGPARTA